MNNRPLKLGIIGAGYWSQFQVAAWQELAGVEILGICDKDEAKARTAAKQHNIPHFFSDAKAMLAALPLDAVDIITDVDSHAHFVQRLTFCEGLIVRGLQLLAPAD